jgi:membrane-associated phospholipid phosphatase
VGSVSAQKDSTYKSPYKVNLKWEIPASASFISVSYFGFRELDRISSFSEKDVAALNPQSVNAFDRPVIFNNAGFFEQAQKKSDLFLNISIASPIVLALSPEVRRDWLSLITLFAVTHTVDNAIYFATAYSVRRARPLTYSPDLDMSQKTGQAKSNSFFSGHVSFSSTSTFFLVKVFTDYYDIKGIKRVLLYTGASIPPALVGYYRMQAGKHFKTDVMVGLLVGGACGIIIPELHKYKIKNLSLLPFSDRYGKGLTLSYQFR